MTYRQAAVALRNFGHRRIKRVFGVTRRRGGVFTGDLMLALGLRETSLHNIVGDFGHGRGWLQMDDRFQGGWLAKVRGARSGTWRAVVQSALRSGFVPLLVPALKRGRSILHQNYVFARSEGVPARQAVRVAVAGFNCGPGNAVQGWREGNPDKFTTGGNYSADVMHNRAHVRRYRKKHGL